MRKNVLPVFFVSLCLLLAAALPGFAAEKSAPDRSQPTKISVGLELSDLSRFEIGPGTWNAVFYLAFTTETAPCTPDFDIMNGTILDKELVQDEPQLKIWKIKAAITDNFDLSAFPFDRHELVIAIAEQGESEGIVYDVAKDLSSVADGARLAGWDLDASAAKAEIAEEKYGTGNAEKFSYYRFSVPIARPTVSALLKNVLPAFIMVLVVILTLFVRKAIMPRLQVQGTGLVGAVIYHLSSTSSLPPLGYLTRMDKFMLATYLVYLASLIFTVLMLVKEEAGNADACTKMHKLGIIVVPAFMVVAWGLVFLNLV